MDAGAVGVERLSADFAANHLSGQEADQSNPTTTAITHVLPPCTATLPTHRRPGNGRGLDGSERGLLADEVDRETGNVPFTL